MNARVGDAPYFVSNQAAETVFDMGEAISALQRAYAGPVTLANSPSRTNVRGEGLDFRVLPAAPAGSRYFGAKMMGVTFQPGGGGFKGAGYVIVLFDREKSEIGAFVDGKFITGYRTAATSGAALDRLADPGPVRLGVLGSGFEATTHVRAFAKVRKISEITVYSPTPERRAAFARTTAEELGIPCVAAESPEAAREYFRERADVVLAAARSHGEKPILFGDDLRPGTTVVSIGSTAPHQRELDVSVVERCDVIVCDDVAEVTEQTGDLIAADEAGVSFRDKCVSLHALMSGEAQAAVGRAGIRMFKSVGGGLQDVVTAGIVLDKAVAAGLAVPLPAHFAH
ncbi:ornithine cyclodeaminase family protein [Streptomyces sp. NPDC058683]|uniref:ornithine cyclodeaminase family protein n=1 Tax=Streptomyces sp. NPDC058683 TaxID=3346597 RepID=UPI00364A3B92